MKKIITEEMRNKLNKMFPQRNPTHTHNDMVRALELCIPMAIANERAKTKKLVDEVKDSIFQVEAMKTFEFKGETLDLITRYQAVNMINLSGLPYTSLEKLTK